MRRCFWLVAVLAGLLPLRALGQQDPQFSQYMFNTLFFNPAYAGSEGFTRFQLVHRSQWIGYSPSFSDPGGALATQSFTADLPILRFRSGVGLTFMNEKLPNSQTNQTALVSVAYHLPVKKGKLSLGARAGFYSQTMDFSVFRPLQIEERFQGRESQLRPDAAAGVFYRTQKYYGGVSVNHIVRSEFDFGSNVFRNPLENHFYATAGYNYDLNYEWVITPSLLFKSQGFKTSSLEGSVLATYKERFWGGLAYRQGADATVILGLATMKDKGGMNALRLGYAFDYTVKGREAKTATSHEILLSYALGPPQPSKRAVTRTPRFRH